jgi:hypothetical protein
MKSTSSFNLSKTSKKLIATTPKNRRSHFKKMMIQAELAAALRPTHRDKKEHKHEQSGNSTGQ